MSSHLSDVNTSPTPEHHRGTLDEAIPRGVDPSLYNHDLAPTKREGRKWSAYNFFALWANDVHSLGNYSFAMGLFALGLGTWQILLALGVGSAFLFVLLCLSGFMGYKTGVPFPVMSRISFGIRGAQIPALIRGGVAIVWFGIQTYLASLVGNVLVIALFPATQPLAETTFLGLTVLGWACFTVLWLIQVVIACYGMEMIRKYEAFAGPVILVTFVILAAYVLYVSGGQIVWQPPNAVSGGEMWREILGGGALWVAIYGTFVLNFCDFTRSAKTKKSIVWGNLFGIPVNTLFFGVIVVVLAGGRLAIDGKVIASPTDVVESIGSTPMLVLACCRAADLDHRRQPDGQLRGALVRPGRAAPPAPELPPGRDRQRHPRLHHPALEPLQLPRGDRLLPRRTGRLPRPPVRDRDGRLLAAAQAADQRAGALHHRSARAPTSTAAGSTCGPSAPSSPPPGSRWCSPSSRP